MKSVRRISALLALLLGLLCLAALVFVFALPHLVAMEPIKRNILVRLSALTGGQIQYQHIRIDYLPRPVMVFQNAELKVPDRFHLSLAELRVTPGLIPLLQGQVELREIHLRQPYMELLLPSNADGTSQSLLSGLGPEDLHTVLVELVSHPLFQKNGLRYKLQDGALHLIHPADGRLRFDHIQAQIQRSDGRLHMALQSESNLWQRCDFNGTLATSGQQAVFRLGLQDFQPHRATTLFFSSTAMPMIDSSLDLDATLKFDPGMVKTELGFGRHRVVLRKDGKMVEFRGKSFGSSVTLQPGSIIVTLNKLQLEAPALEVSGTFFQNLTLPEVRLDLSGRGVHVEPLRERLLTLAGQFKSVRQLFGVLTGGHVPLVSINARGTSFSELTQVENFTVRGSIVKGRVHIPEIDLDLAAVKGDVAIDGGLLKARNLQTQMVQTIGYDGRLTMGLRGRQVPFHLDIETLADMQQLLPVLLRVVRNESFQREMRRISAVTGKARGRLIIGDRLSALTVDASVSYAALQADYTRLPHPVTITGGSYRLSKSGLSFRNLQAAIGAASITDLTGNIEWGPAKRVRATAATADFPIPLFLNWLRQFPHLNSRLQEFEVSSGRARLSELVFDGPLEGTGTWRYELSGVVIDAIIRRAREAQVFQIPEGRFAVRNPGQGPTGISVQPTRVRWAGDWVEMAGTGDLEGGDLLLDLEINARSLSLELLKNTFARRPASAESLGTLSLRGTVGVRCEAFQLSDLRFEPVEAEIQISEDTTTVDIQRADFCGLSVPGRIRFTRNQVHLSLQPAAEDRNLTALIVCASDRDGLISGAYRFSSRIYASGPDTALLPHLNGELRFLANDGRIYRYNMLAKILALVNVTEILRGRLPDIGEEGFAYESIEARAEIRHGILNLKDMMIRGASMTIGMQGDIDLIHKTLDLTGFVAPLKTFDDVVQNLPLLNLFFDNRYLMAIPFSIRGAWDDYHVIPLSTSTLNRNLEGESLENSKINPQSVEPHEK